MACRNPEKIKHATRKKALAAIESLERAGRGNPDLRAYPCGDHWHVGHSVIAFKKRIKKALSQRGGRA